MLCKSCQWSAAAASRWNKRCSQFQKGISHNTKKLCVKRIQNNIPCDLSWSWTAFGFLCAQGEKKVCVRRPLVSITNEKRSTLFRPIGVNFTTVQTSWAKEMIQKLCQLWYIPVLNFKCVQTYMFKVVQPKTYLYLHAHALWAGSLSATPPLRAAMSREEIFQLPNAASVLFLYFLMKNLPKLQRTF